jgi:(p)ppGpp synthase/HD superfamily hydrolase
MHRPIPSTAFRDALTYAADVHNGQVKKGTPIPYFSHLLAVCALVLEQGGDEEEAIACLLHDTLEDHPEKVSREDLHERFGARVARIVEGCTDTPPGYHGGSKPPWHERKRRYIEHLRLEGSSLARVALADKLHNARAMLADYRVLGNALWARFNAGKDDQLWYFRELVGAFRQAGAPVQMLEEFNEVVSELEKLSGAPAD